METRSNRKRDKIDIEQAFLNSILQGINEHLESQWDKNKSSIKMTYDELEQHTKKTFHQSNPNQQLPISKLIAAIYDYQPNLKKLAATAAIKHNPLPLFEPSDTEKKTNSSFKNTMQKFTHLYEQYFKQLRNLPDSIKKQLDEFQKIHKEDLEDAPEELKQFLKKLNALHDKSEYQKTFSEKVNLNEWSKFGEAQKQVKPIYLIVTAKSQKITNITSLDFLLSLYQASKKNENFPSHISFTENEDNVANKLSTHPSATSGNVGQTKIIKIETTPHKLMQILRDKNGPALAKLLETTTSVARDYRINNTSDATDHALLQVKFDEGDFLVKKTSQRRPE